MNLLLLPGNSIRSKAWLAEVEAALAPSFTDTHRYAYRHWETGDPEIDLTYEASTLAEEVKGFGPYVVFAKSAGSLLTAKATSEHLLQPQAALFAGFPLVMALDQDLPASEWLQATDFPLVVLQHSQDPYGSYAAVKDYFQSVGRQNVTVIELPGDSHDYTEFDILKQQMDSLVGAFPT